jgi:alkylhydroperoxidase family enzyme
MARIPYADKTNPTIAPLVAQIERERGKVLNLYSMLLNSEPVARGWLGFLTAIRQQCSLGADVREAVILRVAVINKAPYEFAQHVPHAIKAGMTEQQIALIKDGAFAIGHARIDAALDYAGQSTASVRVSPECFAKVKAAFNTTEIVELTATIGAYNMVSRFLEALEIDHE